ncbi:MAG: hypothetical protein ACREF4_21300, partial [Gammaproteobacteria bacterium]
RAPFEENPVKFTITYNDGSTVEGWAGPRAEVEVERRFDIPVEKANRNEHTYVLFWAGLFYAGQEIREFDEWLATVKDWEIVDEDGTEAKGVGPTRKGRRPAKSST